MFDTFPGGVGGGLGMGIRLAQPSLKGAGCELGNKQNDNEGSGSMESIYTDHNTIHCNT